MPGILWVCATPLGNLDDASPRLLETLKRVAVVCAEDTRHTLRLFNRFDIHTRLESLHEHTSTAKIDILTRRLVEGEEMALVTDAGTPGVSDPGPALVRSASAAGVEVRPVPGPCALVAALSVSGFDAQRFSFVGFLPRKPGKIRKLLESYCAREETFVFYESPFRVGKTLRFLSEVAPEARVVACRELTKQFEETVRGSATEVAENFGARKEIKGEFAWWFRRQLLPKATMRTRKNERRPGVAGARDGAAQRGDISTGGDLRAALGDLVGVRVAVGGAGDLPIRGEK